MPQESRRMDDVPVFGVRVAGCPCVSRPSVYAVIRDPPDRLAVVRTPAGLFLPGGGIEPGETAEEAVLREAREECGLILEPIAGIERAVEIVHSPSRNLCLEKDSLFVEARTTGRVPSHEPDHDLQ